MDIDWNAEIAAQLQTHWSRQLRPRLDGLTDAEYFWEPVAGAWTVRWSRDDARFVSDVVIPPPEPPPVTTIAWRLAHVSALLEMGLERFGGPAVAWTAVTPPAGTASGALDHLDDVFGRWMDGLRGVGTAGLAAPAGPPGSPVEGWTTAAIVLHTHREVIHHGAEVALLRDLYGAG
jgi:DinB superfamily